MIKKKGDLFTTDAKCIGHGVNVRGVMGAGVAKAFREKYKQNYFNYKHRCEVDALRPGSIYVSDGRVNRDGRYIFNMASQREPGADARYEWLFESAMKAADMALYFKYNRIAIPQIGCGIGGLQWDKVEHLLTAIEIIRPDFEWEVWQL